MSRAAELVDFYVSQRTERLGMQKQVEKLEEREKQLKAELIQALKDEKSTAVGGKLAIAKLVVKMEPTAEDFDKLYKHIRDTGEFELLYRRINPASIKERKDHGVEVPGIGWFPVESLSISQIK